MTGSNETSHRVTPQETQLKTPLKNVYIMLLGSMYTKKEVHVLQ